MIDLEQVLAFIESEEMRDYLREELPKDFLMSYSCANIVAYAPAPIERKRPVLEQLAHCANSDLDEDKFCIHQHVHQLARACHTALEERHNGPAGALFWIQDYCGNERDNLFGDAFFTDFDAALSFLEEEAKKAPECFLDPQVSYTITKLVPGSGAQLEEYCVWYLGNNRELWFFDLCRSHRQEDWSELLEYLGNSLTTLPVPFQPGDIVVADCLPYAPPRRVLILEIGDNRDCCAVQALSLHENGRLRTGAFKHNHFLDREISHVSGLYRARRCTGPLTEEEKPFAVLSPLLKERPEWGHKLWNRIYNLELKEQDYSFTWEALKRELDAMMEDEP